MAESYVGEIRIFAGNFAPVGWLFCDGSLLAVNDPNFEVLFQLIGTTYGGDGLANFALPDLRSRVPVHMGQGLGLSPYALGETGGVEAVTLTEQQLPPHTHRALALNAPGTQAAPVNGTWAVSGLTQYSGNDANGAMNARALGSAGSGQPHDNILPYQAINYIISWSGVYPQQS